MKIDNYNNTPVNLTMIEDVNGYRLRATPVGGDGTVFWDLRILGIEAKDQAGVAKFPAQTWQVSEAIKVATESDNTPKSPKVDGVDLVGEVVEDKERAPK